MRQWTRDNDRRTGRSRLRACCLGAALVSGALVAGSPAGALEIEPLMLRVQDAVGAPGEQTAIVIRTYASRPVRRGRVSSGVAPLTQLPGEASRLGATSTPIQSCDAAMIFSVNGDVAAPACAFDEPTQTFDVNFESLSATINARDGVFGVLYVTLAPDVVPGDEYTISLDLGSSFLDDPEDDPVLLETRAGTLTIRAPTDPVSFSVDGGKVQPGSGAVIEVGTAEPFDLKQGRLLISYDPAIASDLPEVDADPRHGDVSLSVSYPQAGRVQIDFNSALEDWNRVPGDLLILHFGTPASVPVGTLSPLAFLTGPNQSALVGPGSIPLQVAWGQNGIDFELDPGIFNDGFDIGDTGFWSYLP